MTEKRQPVSDAQAAVLLQLAIAHERFTEQERVLAAEGRVAEAEGAHKIALRLVRAYKAEKDNP